MIDTKNLVCPLCKIPLDNIRGVTAGSVPDVGDGFLCPCGFLGEFTADSQIKSVDETKMSHSERVDLDFARRVLKTPRRDTNSN